jgi:uncharacterized ferredoxin-like protein
VLIQLTWLVVIIRSGEAVNELLAKNWRSFSSENYFDEKGIFYSGNIKHFHLLTCISCGFNAIDLFQYLYSNQLIDESFTNDDCCKKKATYSICQGARLASAQDFCNERGLSFTVSM